MANTDISICSRALVLLGEKPLTSFSERRDAVRVCDSAYPGLKRAILSQYPWRFAMKKVKLTLEAAAPVNEWRYQFLIPGDALAGGAFAVFDTATPEASPIHDYEIFGRRLLANKDELWADYRFEPAESLWPEYFVQLMVYALCAEIAFAITDQQNAADSWQYKAYGSPSENGMGGQMATALASQAQGQGNIGIASDFFVEARFGGN